MNVKHGRVWLDGEHESRMQHPKAVRLLFPLILAFEILVTFP